MPNVTGGQAYNADTLDDVSQRALALGRKDSPEEMREKLDRGQVVFNYGGYFIFRKQDWDLLGNPEVISNTGGVVNKVSTAADLSANITPRNAWALIPDIYLRLNWQALELEMEVALIGGRIDSVSDLNGTADTKLTAATKGYTLLEWGGVLRGKYSFLRGQPLHVGLEIGYASGDGAEDSTGKVNFQARSAPIPTARPSAASSSIRTTRSTSFCSGRSSARWPTPPTSNRGFPTTSA